MSWRIEQGHALDVMKQMPSESAHCVITSPPYWGLRDYKSEPLVWGGDHACDHRWDSSVRKRKGSTNGRLDLKSSLVSAGAHKTVATGDTNDQVGTRQYRSDESALCLLCGAWRGSLGLEPTPDLYVQHLVEIFREARRVLRPDGTFWLNIGDSHGGGGGQGATSALSSKLVEEQRRADTRGSAIKSKDLVGIPWMTAFALRADGWYLRSDIIWAKGVSFCQAYAGSCMPESVADRPTRGHEYVFLFSKSSDYYFDMEAIKERGVRPAGTIAAVGSGTREGNRIGDADGREYSGTRQPRTVWAISPRGFNGEFCTACRRFFDGPTKREIRVVKRGIGGKHARDTFGTEGAGHRSGCFGNGPSLEDITGAVERDIRICPCGRSDAWLSHFATFPEELVIPMIQAGASQAGCCAKCGMPYSRMVERHSRDGRSVISKARNRQCRNGAGMPITGDPQRARALNSRKNGKIRDGEIVTGFPSGEPRITVGWEAQCRHDEAKPCVVLDPFAGSGTVLLAAQKLGRDSVGIELNPDYADMAKRRIEGDAPLFNAESAASVAASDTQAELFG